MNYETGKSGGKVSCPGSPRKPNSGGMNKKATKKSGGKKSSGRSTY